MEQMLIYKYCPELSPFILFDAELSNGVKISCVGHEYHCLDPKCDCYLTNIMIHEVNTGERITQVIYGWRYYAYYKKERFLKDDIKGFINGDLSYLEERNDKNIAILAGFKTWLLTEREQKIKKFNERYKQFRVLAKSKIYDANRETRVFINSIHELEKAGKLEELIFGSR